MGFGIIRVREIKRSEVSATQEHNEREYEKKGKEIPSNINPEGTKFNTTFFKSGDSITEAIENRLIEAKVSERKNSVVALEFVISASKDIYHHLDERFYLENSTKWIEERYGKENVVSGTIHYDETNPHIHLIVTPIVQKEAKWKNQKGEGVKIENRLCARDLTGTKEHLIKLQDDFYKHLDQKYNYRWNFNETGFVRGKSAIEQNKKYTKQTSVELGVLKEETKELTQILADIKRNALDGIISHKEAIKSSDELLVKLEIKEKEIQKIEVQIENIEKETVKIEKRQEKNAGDGWKKGKDFGKGKDKGMSFY